MLTELEAWEAKKVGREGEGGKRAGTCSRKSGQELGAEEDNTERTISFFNGALCTKENYIQMSFLTYYLA